MRNSFVLCIHNNNKHRIKLIIGFWLLHSLQCRKLLKLIINLTREATLDVIWLKYLNNWISILLSITKKTLIKSKIKLFWAKLAN